MRSTLLFALVLAASCAPTEDPYAPVTTEWDDVATALKCNPDDPGQSCLEPHPDTVRVDDELRFNFEAADFDDTTGVLTLKLKAGAKLDARLKEGAFLYRGRKDRRPLLHRVDGVRVEGQVVTMKLSRARPKDVFTKGRLRTRLPLSGVASQGAPLSGGVTRQPLEVAIGPRNCAGVVFDKTLATVNSHGQVKLELTECRFLLTAWVDALIEWDSGLANVDRLELTVGGSADAALHATLTLDLDGRYGERKRIWEGPEIPFTVGGIVITVNPALYAGYELSAKANLVATQGFDLTQSMEVGFGYSDYRGWYSIDERTSSFTKFGPTLAFDGNITATAFVQPELALKAFGFVGGTVALKGFAEARLTSTATASGGTYSGELCTDLDLGLTPSVGAVAELFGVQLFSEDVALTTFRTAIVKNSCAAYTGPVPSDCDASSGCCTDGQCTTPDDPAVTVKCVKGAQLAGGKYRYACEQQYPANYCLAGSSTAATVCDDGESLTIDSCVDNRCQNVLRDGPAADVAAQASGTKFPPATTCVAPGCCYVNSDCADGDRLTLDRCVKTGSLQGPDVKGSCG